MKTKTTQLEFFIPGNVPSSKNGRMWTGNFLIASEATRRWRTATKKDWTLHKANFLRALSKLEKPYKIEFTFIRGSKHKFDYVNPLQTILDEMVKYGWLEDDNCTVVKPFFGDYSYNKETPGVIIKIIK